MPDAESEARQATEQAIASLCEMEAQLLAGISADHRRLQQVRAAKAAARRFLAVLNGEAMPGDGPEAPQMAIAIPYRSSVPVRQAVRDVLREHGRLRTNQIQKGAEAVLGYRVANSTVRMVLNQLRGDGLAVRDSERFWSLQEETPDA